MAKRNENREVRAALKTFENAAFNGRSENEAIQACMSWEILLSKHRNTFTKRTLDIYERRGRVALGRLLGWDTEMQSGVAC